MPRLQGHQFVEAEMMWVCYAAPAVAFDPLTSRHDNPTRRVHAHGTPIHTSPDYTHLKTVVLLARSDVRDRSGRSIRSTDGGGSSLVGWRGGTSERTGTRALRNQRTRLFESIRGNREKIDRAMNRLRDATVRKFTYVNA